MAEPDLTGASQSARLLLLLLSKDKNDRLCCLDRLREIFLNGYGTWNPIPSDQAHDIEESSVYTLKTDSEQETDDEVAAPRLPTDEDCDELDYGDAAFESIVEEAECTKQDSKHEKLSVKQSGGSVQGGIRGGLQPGEVGLKKKKKKVKKPPPRAHGGDEQVVLVLKEFFELHISQGVELRRVDDSTELLMLRGGVLHALLGMLKELIQTHAQTCSNHAQSVDFLESKYWLLSRLMYILKLAARVKGLKQLLASPRQHIGLVPALATILNTFHHELPYDILGNSLAVLENLCSHVRFEPSSRSSDIFSRGDSIDILKCILRMCYDHTVYDMDMQTRAFSCLRLLVHKKKETAAFIIFHLHSASCDPAGALAPTSSQEHRSSGDSKLLHSICAAVNHLDRAAHLGTSNTLFVFTGILANFLAGKLVSSQKSCVNFVFDILNIMVSYEEESINTEVFSSSVLPQILSILESNHRSEEATACIRLVDAMCRGSVETQRLWFQRSEELRLLLILSHHIAEAPYASKKIALKLLLLLVTFNGPDDPLIHQRESLLRNLLSEESNYGILGHIIHILVAHGTDHAHSADHEECMSAALLLMTRMAAAQMEHASLRSIEEAVLTAKHEEEHEAEVDESTNLQAAISEDQGAVQTEKLHDSRMNSISPCADICVLDQFDKCWPPASFEDKNCADLDPVNTPKAPTDEECCLSLLEILSQLFTCPGFQQRTSPKICDNTEDWYDHDIKVPTARQGRRNSASFGGVMVMATSDDAFMPRERRPPEDRDHVPMYVVHALALICVFAQTTNKDTIRKLWAWDQMPILLSYLRVNNVEVMDSTSPESQAEQCIITLLSILLTSFYEGETSTIATPISVDSADSFKNDIPLDKYSEDLDMRSIITRDIRKMQLEYQLARKITRAGVNVDTSRFVNVQIHPCHTKIVMCLVLLVANRPSLPEGLLPKTLVNAANMESKGFSVQRRSTEDDTHVEKTQFGAIEYVFDEISREQDENWPPKTSDSITESSSPQKKDPRRGSTMANTSNANHSEKPTSANSAYSARHCYETFKRILSDWLHIEVKHHDIDTQSKNSGTFSGVSVHPRRLTQFHGSELGLPRFGIVLLDNHHSVLTSDQLFDREAKSMNNENDKEKGCEISEISVHSDISLAELELLGADIPIEAILMGLREIAIGAASDGHPGGYFSPKGTSVTPPVDNNSKEDELPEPFVTHVFYSYNSAQQFMCTPTMIALIIDCLVECFERSGYKQIDHWYKTKGRHGHGKAPEKAGTQRPGWHSNGRRIRKAQKHTHSHYLPRNAHDPNHESYSEVPITREEQLMHRRCISLCVEILLHLSFLYTDSFVGRIMIDWFPDQEDMVQKFIPLLATLTNVVNVHKMLAVIYEHDCEQLRVDGKEHSTRKKTSEKFGYNIPEANRVSRMCKALYRTLRAAKADDSFESEAHTLCSDTLAGRVLLNDKLDTMGNLEPRYIPVATQTQAHPTAPEKDNGGKHIVFSYYHDGYNASRSRHASLLAGHGPTVETLAARVQRDMKGAEVWTYERGSCYSPSTSRSEKQFYLNIDDDDDTNQVNGSFPNINVNDASSMNRDSALDAMDSSNLIFILLSKDYVTCPLCRLECLYAKDLCVQKHARVVFIFLESTYNPVNFKTKVDRNQAWKTKVETVIKKARAGSSHRFTQRITSMSSLIKAKKEEKILKGSSQGKKAILSVRNRFATLAAASKVMEMQEKDRDLKRLQHIKERANKSLWRQKKNSNIPHTIPQGLDGWARNLWNNSFWFALWSIGSGCHNDHITSYISVCEHTDFNSGFIIPEISFKPRRTGF